MTNIQFLNIIQVKIICYIEYVMALTTITISTTLLLNLCNNYFFISI